MIMGMNELLAETLTLGEKSGIGQQTVYNLIKGKLWKAFMPYLEGELTS
jgi:3-hydroxyisobutyrate dehydrogenase-like beta-hydroxyacid dehydrogenase